MNAEIIKKAAVLCRASRVRQRHLFNTIVARKVIDNFRFANRQLALERAEIRSRVLQILSPELFICTKSSHLTRISNLLRLIVQKLVWGC
ncbi:hypothetical protein L2E82_30653 [Cichorium intybus]|uniref:Uncharacterized protein n=1 Tax=Cichorium intybus TaxID=13427 RepID=A0ACB9D0U0_CICIN|nr:hypothetical protein L2E82_30653 [Cichorium intybus]